MNDTDWAGIEDSENERPYAPARKPYRPVTDANDFLMGGGDDREGKGPWIVASFDSECPCGDPIFEGDMIRADGDGEWEGQECCG